MNFKKSLLGMVGASALILGSASPVYSQEKYQKYSEPASNHTPVGVGFEESVVAFAIYCLIKKIEGRK